MNVEEYKKKERKKEEDELGFLYPFSLLLNGGFLLGNHYFTSHHI